MTPSNRHDIFWRKNKTNLQKKCKKAHEVGWGGEVRSSRLELLSALWGDLALCSTCTFTHSHIHLDVSSTLREDEVVQINPVRLTASHSQVLTPVTGSGQRAVARRGGEQGGGALKFKYPVAGCVHTVVLPQTIRPPGCLFLPADASFLRSYTAD